MDWNDLYRVFTEKISPGARRRILQAIADSKRKLITGRFYGDGGGCLFAVAHVEALEADFSALFGSHDKITAMSHSLGISREQITEGVLLWDSGGSRPVWCFSEAQWKKTADLRRARFRERIRRHLESGRSRTPCMKPDLLRPIRQH